MKSKKIVFFFITFLTLSTFLTFIPNSSGILKLSESKIFNGLYANYTGTGMISSNSSFTYNHDSGTLYNVSWWQQGSGIAASWLEDTQTRLTSSASAGFGSGVHTPIWIFTNMSIGNATSVAVDGVGDHPYTVTGEATVNYPGFGTINVWILEDDWYFTLAWYEKTTGLLINGTFQWFGGGYTLDLNETNMFSYYQPSPIDEIPGYILVVFLPITIVITVLVLRKWKKKL